MALVGVVGVVAEEGAVEDGSGGAGPPDLAARCHCRLGAEPNRLLALLGVVAVVVLEARIRRKGDSFAPLSRARLSRLVAGAKEPRPAGELLAGDRLLEKGLAPSLVVMVVGVDPLSSAG